MCEIMEGQVGLFGQDTWSGKTSPELSAAGTPKAPTSPPSSKKSSKSQSREPVCLCVYQTEDGQNPGAITLRMVLGQLLGEYTTPSFGECPREENASRLSQILEDCPLPKYSLSARACQGILNRAERRGKELPPELKAALIAQANLSETDGLNKNTPTTTPEMITRSVCKETESTEQTPQDATALDGAGGGGSGSRC